MSSEIEKRLDLLRKRLRMRKEIYRSLPVDADTPGKRERRIDERKRILAITREIDLLEKISMVDAEDPLDSDFKHTDPTKNFRSKTDNKMIHVARRSDEDAKGMQYQ